MTLENWISICGSIGSVLGALFSLWQCSITVKAKNETKAIQEKFVKKYVDYELSHLRPKIKLVVDKITKHTLNSRKGLNINEDLNYLKEIVNDIRSNSIYSENNVKSNLDNITELMNQKIEDLKLNDIVICLTNISREFDYSIRKEL